MSRRTPRSRIWVEIRLAMGSRVGAFAFLSLALASTFALAIGWYEIAGQREEIQRAHTEQQVAEAAQAERSGPDIDAGTAGYERFYLAADPPAAWSFLALGTRESGAPMQRVRMLGLEAQIRDGEFRHPNLAAAGSFDFAFVVVFLLPLTLIAVLHDLRSGEREIGRLTLVSSLLHRPIHFWLTRLGVRLALVLLAVFLPLGIAVLVLRPPLLPLLLVVGAVTAYAIGWSLVAATVALRPRASSAGSAILLVGVWCLWVLVLPGLSRAHASRAYPVTDAAEIVLAQRQKVNDAWDLPKEATFEEFFEHYPEWSETAPVTTRFHWKWYFAFHEVGDRSVAEAVSEYRRALEGRERLIETWSVLVPPLALQRVLTASAQTDATRRWAHEDAVRGFHAGLRKAYYPYLFEDRAFDIKTEDHRFQPAPREMRIEWTAMAGLSAFALLSVMFTGVRKRMWSR